MRLSALVPVAATSVALMLWIASAGAQSLVGPDRVGWAVNVPDARRTTEPRHFRAFSEPAVVELQFGMTNESDVTCRTSSDH
jgi:hypothetical protein